MSDRVTVVGVSGVPEVGAGADLAALVCTHAPDLADGDVVVVTSKAVSKAEGRVRRAEREAAVAAETVRVVARRGPTTIARTAQGLTLAAAGVDASNTEAGTVVLLPVDPDASARRLRAAIRERGGHNVAVVVSDTAGRPWREGQTDIAVGCAGLTPLDDHAGRRDSHGHELSVTAPALADEVAGAADLVMGKSAGRPAAVVRGLAEHVLAPGTDGPGAAALLRPEDEDMFVLGAREAVLAAVCRDDPAALALLTASSGRTTPVHALVERAGGRGALEARGLGAGEVEVRGPAGPGDPESVVALAAATALERVCALAAVHGWRVAADDRNRGVCRIVLRSGPAGP